MTRRAMLALALFPAFLMGIGCGGARVDAASPAGKPLPPGGVSLLPADAVGAFKLQGDAVDVARVEVVDVAGQPFARAVRIHTLKRPANMWLVQVQAQTIAPVTKGDVVHARFWIRCASSMTGEAATNFIFELGRSPWTKSQSYPASAGSTWRCIDAPFVAQQDFAPGEASINFHAGFDPQAIEIGGVEVVDYGRKLRLEDLPRTKATYAGSEPDAAWRQAAAERIEAIRKGDLAVTVTDAAGKPVEGATVRVAMKRHAFGFGSAIDAGRLMGDSADSLRYRETVRTGFSKVVFENDLKWGEWAWENPRRRATMFKALEWLEEQGIPVRGHCLVWPAWGNMPKDVKGLAADKAALRKRILDHVREEVRALKGRIPEWDVINEPYSNHDVMDILGNDCMVEWYQAARAEDPKAVLYLNDYSILTGGGRDTAHQDHYEKTLKFLIEKGAPLGGIGLQGHFGQDVTAPTKLLQILDRFGRLGLPMHVTEFDVNTADRDLQAAYTRDFMTVLFSHPQVAGILMWGFWAGQHWKPDAALYDRDWTIRPHGKVWMDLVLKEWWTDAAARTDARGACKVRGFLGEYEVTVEAGGKTKAVRATLAKPGARVEVPMEP